jgi:hypothetical protein
LCVCLSDNATTPAVVAEAAVNEWLAAPDLRQMLLGNWTRIGIGYDWGCPMVDDNRGVVLVLLLAGGVRMREG